MTSPPPAQSLRAALIGCGRIGAHTAERLRQNLPPGWLPVNHADAMLAAPGIDLVAVCDLNGEQSRSTAERLGMGAWFTDHQEMIRAVKPDIVSIATRTEGRCDIVEFAAAHGVRGIHVEKPLGRSLDDCRRALDACQQHGVHLSYGTTRRCMGIFRLAKSMIDDGEIGPLRQITIELGRAALLWTHPHSFDLMTWLAGGREVISVQSDCTIDAAAIQDLNIDADPIVENAVVRFADGLNACITCAPGMNFRLVGEHGGITIGANAGWLAVERSGKEGQLYASAPVQVPFTPATSGTMQAFIELASAINGCGDAPITAADILRSNQLVFAVAWSALHQGRVVTLDEVPGHLTITGRQGANFA